jgi:hypothetical protein
MKLDALQAANAERQQSVFVLQVTERALNGGAAAVEGAEALSVARDVWEQPATKSSWEGYLLPVNASERDDRFTIARFAVAVHAVVVIALVHRARLRPESPQADSVEKRRNEVGFLPSRCFDPPGPRQPGGGADSRMDFEAVVAAALAG